jgi:hypothetical protein
VKAFHFRLDPALRWRATQLRLEQETVSRIVRQVAALQEELIATHNELRAGSTQLASAGSVAFQSWAAYLERCRRRIRALEEQLIQARKALVLQTNKAVDAHRRLRALENLKGEDSAEWAKELGRETEAFAGEAFLARLSRKSRATDTTSLRAVVETRATDTTSLRATIEKRTGA